MTDCIFCKIAQNSLPSEIVFENENFLAFKDIFPRAPIHYLIIPKNHIESIASDNSEEIAGELIRAAKKIAEDKKISGYKLVFNVGEAGGQIVPHLHLHFLAGGDSELKI
ncbi:MAG: histidine triad nucleotide-binding protein [Candidatus Pacebacteria bacterium]|nr:histidine triad nucleotide-binding protein [Candidatus Paceibacterota bacterium]